MVDEYELLHEPVHKNIGSSRPARSYKHKAKQMFYTLFVTEDRKAIVTVTEKADKEAEKQLLESNGYKVKRLQRAETFAKEETLKVWLEYCDLPMSCMLKEPNFGYDREEPESDELL